MSDISELPNNAANYYRKALNELSLNNAKLAIDYLEKSYALDALPQTFEELVKALLTNNYNDKLRQLWQKANYSFEDIIQSERLAALYAHSIPTLDLTEEGLLKLYRLRDNIQSDRVQKEINNAIQMVDATLITHKKFKQLQKPADTQKLAQELFALSPLKLLTELKVIYKLPIDLIEGVLKLLLQEKTLLNYIKSDILHYLIYQNYSGQLTLNWFKEDYSIKVEELSPYNEHPFYQAGIALIQDKMGKENPHLIEEITQMFTLHIMVFYPFIEQAIGNPENWLQEINSTYQLFDESNSNDNTDINTYVELANVELEQLFRE